MTTRSLSAATLVLALGSALSLSTLTTVAHADDAKMEKCFGVALKGKNDCAAGQHYLCGHLENRLPGQRLEPGP